MSGQILFLTHRLPFPPDRGDKIRAHHVLRALAAIAPVHVGCLAETDSDMSNGHELARISANWCMPKRSKPLPLAGAEALLRRKPVSLTAFRSRRLAHWVRQTLATHDIAAIYVFSGQMGQYVPHDWRGRLIVDLVDVDSAKFESYAKRRHGPRKWIDAREARLLKSVEAELVARADTTLLVSEAEAALLRGRVDGAHEIRTLRNGVDCALFDPGRVKPEPLLAQGGPHFVFTGQMDYAPNVEAVARMALRIMPEVLRTLPQAQLHVVGRAPAREVRALDGVNGTHVVGAVTDTRPWLAAADVVVAPLDIARGVQNKVLEAMAMARPLVVSPGAAIGIGARGNTHFMVAEDDAGFVTHLLRLSQEPDFGRGLGEEARRFVREEMTWPAMLADLPTLLGMPDRSRRHAA